MLGSSVGAGELTPTEINGLVLISQSFDVSLQVQGGVASLALRKRLPSASLLKTKTNCKEKEISIASDNSENTRQL